MAHRLRFIVAVTIVFIPLSAYAQNPPAVAPVMIYSSGGQIVANNCAANQVATGIDATGTLTCATIPASLGTQTANTIFSGPVSGGAANPTFRVMVAADMGTTLTPQFGRLGLGAAADAANIFTVQGADNVQSIVFPTVTYTSNMATKPTISVIATENTAAGTHDYLKMAITRTAGEFNFFHFFGGAAGTTDTAFMARDGSLTTIGDVNALDFISSAGSSSNGAFQTAAAFTANTRVFYNAGTRASSNTGSNAVSAWDLFHTLNTSGVPSVFKLAVTDTAHGAATKLADVLGGAAGTVSMWNLTLNGTAPSASITQNLAGNLAFSGTTGVAVANVGANSCGTSAATIAGTDNIGIITVGATSGTQCRITFTVTAAARWICQFEDETTANIMRPSYVDTTHVDVLGTMVAGDVINYICFPR